MFLCLIDRSLQYQRFGSTTSSSYWYYWSIIFSSITSHRLVRSCRRWCMPQTFYQTPAEMYAMLVLLLSLLSVRYWECVALNVQVGLAVLQQGSNTYAECLQYYKQLLSKKNSKHVCYMTYIYHIPYSTNFDGGKFCRILTLQIFDGKYFDG